MRFISVLVEGQTEALFINQVLSRTLPDMIWTPAYVMATAPRRAQAGTTTYKAWRNKVLDLLANPTFAAVTTMFDFDVHHLPNGMPGLDKARDPVTGTALQRVQALEQAVAADIAHRRFVPYFSLHDFEALLFSDVTKFTRWQPDLSPRIIAQLERIRDAYPSPEHINDDMPPSRRLTELIRRYQITKPEAGFIVAEAIGLPTLRQHCPHFDQWLNTLISIPLA